MLSFKKSEKPIAVIKGGDYDKKIIYIHDNIDNKNKIDVAYGDYIDADTFRDGRKNLKMVDINKIYRALQEGYDIEDIDLAEYYQKAKKEVEIKNQKEFRLNDGELQILPSITKNQRECLYITAPSGAGKSTFTGKYLARYHKQFPENDIFIFSKKISDPAFDKYDYITRIELDEEFINGEPLDCKNLSDSLCIFDDIENIPNKKIKEAVYKLKDNLLETGRSNNIYICICNHIAMNYKETRKDINESTGYVFFKNGNTYHIKRFLKDYIGIDPEKIKKLLDLPSRWVMINKTYPMYAISENECFLL